MAERQQVDISTSSIFRALLVLVAFFLIYLLSNVILILLFAIVIASAVGPFATWFEKRGLPRLVAVLILYLLVAGLAIALTSLVIPSVSSDLSQFGTYLPKITAALSNSLDTVQNGGASRYFDFVGEIQNILNSLTSYLQQFSQSALSLAVNAFGGLFSFIAILVISFYLSVMRNGIETFLSAVVPEQYEEYIVNLWRRAELKVGYWLQGQLFLCLVVGLLVYIGLSLLKVKFALLFAILMMVMEIVPVAGPVLGAIPAILFAFIQQPALGLWVALLYLVVQQTESNILVPLVIGKTTGLNPIVVMLAILTGGQLAGIAGAILGVPIATVIVDIVDDLAKMKSSRRAT